MRATVRSPIGSGPVGFYAENPSQSQIIRRLAPNNGITRGPLD
jgi:hypothetical protein